MKIDKQAVCPNCKKTVQNCDEEIYVVHSDLGFPRFFCIYCLEKKGE